MKITIGRLAAAAVAGAVLPAVIVPATSAATHAARGAGAAAVAVARGHAGAVRESGTLNCAQLEALWEQAGGSPSAAFLAAEVAMAESGGRQYAINRNTNGTADRGYWQVNDGAWGSRSTFSPDGNAEAAAFISHDGTNWSAWVTYNSGAYRGRC